MEKKLGDKGRRRGSPFFETSLLKGQQTHVWGPLILFFTKEPKMSEEPLSLQSSLNVQAMPS
jgi:hypothetical protein